MSNRFSFIIAKILRRISFLDSISLRYNLHRHQKIMKKLEPLFQETFNELQSSHVPNRITYKKIIWVFWWQDQKNLPPISKLCYQSILKNSGNYQVILITKHNIEEYADLPKYIYQKVANQQITLTHLSDILRFNLLNRYGGLWLDLTLLAVQDFCWIDLRNGFTVGGCPANNYFNVSGGRWTGFFIGGPVNWDLFRFMDLFFKNYWQENNSLEDYFLIDYALNYCWQNNIGQFRQVCNRGVNLAPQLFKLQDLLNQPYNRLEVQHLLSSTPIFKLSNRQKLDLNNKNNIFNHLSRLI